MKIDIVQKISFNNGTISSLFEKSSLCDVSVRNIWNYFDINRSLIKNLKLFRATRITLRSKNYCVNWVFLFNNLFVYLTKIIAYMSKLDLLEMATLSTKKSRSIVQKYLSWWSWSDQNQVKINKVFQFSI